MRGGFDGFQRRDDGIADAGNLAQALRRRRYGIGKTAEFFDQGLGERLHVPARL